ncbi:hypothetical protein [Dokdonella sp.]|uniref:hypothetical protein n=1 Tax=Dokdonella sp. TaxID=2291710 RepID=UPI0031BCEA6A|nr:hypothetical protein [Dokdonella sp.]
MTDPLANLATDVAGLHDELARLRAELAELRDYIGEVPMMECGITSFEEWKREREEA